MSVWFRGLAKVFPICAIFASVVLANTDSSAMEASAPDTSFRVKMEHSLMFIGTILPHRSLRNSESLHDWPFFAFASPLGWNSSLKTEKDVGSLVTVKGMTGLGLTLFGVGLRADATVALLRLLELGVEGSVGSAVNFGSCATFMGVYDPDKQEFSPDLFLTEFSYGVKYHAGMTLPLMLVLPKSEWTRILLRPTAELTYSAYTGAEDGEVWKAGSGNYVNGYHYRWGGTLMYMLPFKHVPMAMFAANVSGFLHESDFDAVYKPYDPTFKTITLTPMLSIKFDDKWGGMLMGNFSRDRKYRHYHFESGTELSQERIGTEWGLKAVMMTLSRKV